MNRRDRSRAGCLFRFSTFETATLTLKAVSFWALMNDRVGDIEKRMSRSDRGRYEIPSEERSVVWDRFWDFVMS